MKKLTQIAKELRSKYTESEIVNMIKNRQVEDIEENGYTQQQNYSDGVEVFTGNEECGSVLFGHR